MEKETTKLINVLRRIARAAGYLLWVKSDPEAARFCVNQFNRVLARLNELEPGTSTLFTALADDASPNIVRMAARDVIAYFADEDPEPNAFGFALGCGPRRLHSRKRCIPIAVHCE